MPDLWHHPYWLALPTIAMAASAFVLVGFVVVTGTWVMSGVMKDKLMRDGPGQLGVFVACLVLLGLFGLFLESF